MRQAQQRVTAAQTSRTYSRPAPIGGWNARDSLADMKDGDAVVLKNFFPRSTSVDLRNGSINWATGFGATTVDTVMAWNPPSGSGKLYAAAGTNIYDITAQGAIGAAVVAGLASAKWQYVNVATAGGNYLYAVNGVDSPLLWNGAAWQAVTGVSAPIAITGVTTTNLIHICVFKNRVFFIEKNTMLAWYLPINSVGGAALQFDFRTLFRRGGYLMAMDVWTLDGGYGMDDYACWVSSEGEIAIYRGIDISSAFTWSLVGVYQAGSPMGRRCFMKYGGDLILICRDGMVSVSTLLQSTRVNPTTNLTYKIQGAITDATTAYAANFGWQALLCPNQNMVTLNVPIGTGIQEQYVMNTITGSWCQFTGWAANCWERFVEEMYFGTGLAASNVVAKAMTTTSDNGAAIVGSVVEAFSYFGPRSLLKCYQMARPVLFTSGSISATMNMVTDFDSNAVIVGVPAFSAGSSSLWDTAKWDSGLWSGGKDVNKDWQYVDGYGYSGALKMNISTGTATVSWVSTDYLYSIGSVL